jgi:ribose transport system permease protein
MVRRLLAGAGLLPILFVLLVALLAALEPHFLAPANLANVLRSSAYLVIAGAGQMLVLIVGGFDLSVGAVIALTSVAAAGTMAWLPGVGVHGALAVSVLGALAGLLCGLGVGLINGACVAWLRVPPFMATLGTLSAAQGLALLLTNGIPVYGMPAEFVAGVGRANLLGLPVACYAAAAVVLALVFVQSRTVLGRALFAVGGNAQAARVSGVPVNAVLVTAYALCSLLASLAGLLLTAQIGSGQATTGESLTLESIAAGVIAGVSLRGGVGRVELVALGAVFLLTLTNAMDLLHVDSKLQLIALGFVLVAAVALERLGERLGERLREVEAKNG